MLTEEQKKDLKDKKDMLINILNLNDKKDLDVANAMLLKGRGYRKEDLADGRIQKIIGDKEDFYYRCEIGKMIDIYLSDDLKFDVAQSDILDTAKKLSTEQLKICAENIKERLSLAMKVIQEDEKKETHQVHQDFKNEVISQMKKCNEVLNCQKG